MNVTTKHFMPRLLFSIMLSAGLLTAIARPAAAHKYEVRPIAPHYYYYRHASSAAFPRWLKRNRDFQRWYLRSDYCCQRRIIRGAYWDHMYDMYVFEKRHQRRAKRHFRSRAYVDSRHYAQRRYR